MSQGAHDTPSTESTESTGLESGGEKIDFQSLFGQTKEELESVKAHSQKVEKEFSDFRNSAQESQKILDKLKSALSGADESTTKDAIESEIEDLESEVQTFIQAAHEADKAGKPMPLTAKIGIDNAKRRIAALKNDKEYKKEIADLKEQLKKVTDPGFVGMQQLYDRTDLAIENVINSIYPQDEHYSDVRQSQTQSLQRLVGNEFKRLAAEDPESWQRVKRDPKALQNLVAHYAKQQIPPAARKLMEEDKVKREPLDFPKTFQAFREMKEIVAKDPKNKKNREILSKLKGEVWASYNQSLFKGKKTKFSGTAD